MEESQDFKEEGTPSRAQDCSRVKEQPSFDVYYSQQKEQQQPTPNSEPPVLEQLWNVLSLDAQAKIQRRFDLCFVGIVMFWIGVWVGNI
jgi:hypothetical protein